MENKLAMQMLGTTNVIKTFCLFVKWVLKPQTAVDLANEIVMDIDNYKNINAKVIAIGYLNEFFSKYIEFGKSNKEIVEINEIVDSREKTNDRILKALMELREIRTKLKRLNKNRDDQLIPTTKSFGISSGTITGKSLNITSTKQMVPKGCIGVFPTSGTKYTTQFLKCIGIIFLNGSITSHGAILAREYKIPAIVSPNLKIKDDENVLINGSSGEIKVVDTIN